MANPLTPAPISLTGAWIDLYVNSSITVGQPLIVTCRGSASAYIAEATSQPAADFAGIEVPPTQQYFVDNQSAGLWGRAATGTNTQVVVQLDNKG